MSTNLLCSLRPSRRIYAIATNVRWLSGGSGSGSASSGAGADGKTTEAEGEGDSFIVRPPRPSRAEPVEQLRSRLLFQSRKRGIKENDLIFSTFAGKYLKQMSEAELKDYDVILNEHDNEWDMFYCLTKKKPVPAYLQQSTVLPRLIAHVENTQREVRIDSPPLKP